MNAIEVKGLSKKFDLYPSAGKRLLEFASRGKIQAHTEFLALQDISFEVSKGSTFGIIGQNGSGKSTLLSILAGVLQPTSGSFSVNGRVSALLELGAGFHPEFSGRDNVYMYGTIMGLSKKEIDNRFDDIVDFSELHEFIDQPLRTYSSGMVVRLAFSVAVNVDADILIVDEALAVGDALFQHRCFRKIKELQESGKTILYVGHDMEAIRSFCERALLLDRGVMLLDNLSNIVINKYQALIVERERAYFEGLHNKSNIQTSKNTIVNEKDFFGFDSAQFSTEEEFGNKDIEITSIEFLDDHLTKKNIFSYGDTIYIQMKVKVHKDIDKNIIFGYTLKNKYTTIYGTNTLFQNIRIKNLKKGEEFTIEFKHQLFLANGAYSVSLGVVASEDGRDIVVLNRKYDAAFFTVSHREKIVGFIDLHASIQLCDRK